MPRSLLPVLLAGVVLAACRSDAEKLVELRSELRADLDALYARYGGGALASHAQADAERPEKASEGASTAARFLGEMDRAYFEGYCLAHGRGERPFNLSGKLDAFMKEPANREACHDAARLEARVRELEAKLAPN